MSVDQRINAINRTQKYLNSRKVQSYFQRLYKSQFILEWFWGRLRADPEQTFWKDITARCFEKEVGKILTDWLGVH